MNFLSLSFIYYFGIFFNTNEAVASIAIAFYEFWNFTLSCTELTTSYNYFIKYWLKILYKFLKWLFSGDHKHSKCFNIPQNLKILILLPISLNFLKQMLYTLILSSWVYTFCVQQYRLTKAHNIRFSIKWTNTRDALEYTWVPSHWICSGLALVIFIMGFSSLLPALSHCSQAARNCITASSPISGISGLLLESYAVVRVSVWGPVALYILIIICTIIKW